MKIKPLLYEVPNKISENEIIPLIQKLTQLEEIFLLPHLAFVQIYKVYDYGQYASVINVPTNVNQTQFILSHVPYVETIIGVFFKWCFEYKSPYIKKCQSKHGDVHYIRFDENVIIQRF